MYVQHSAEVQHVYVCARNALSICNALCMQSFPSTHTLTLYNGRRHCTGTDMQEASYQQHWQRSLAHHRIATNREEAEAVGSKLAGDPSTY